MRYDKCVLEDPPSQLGFYVLEGDPLITKLAENWLFTGLKREEFSFSKVQQFMDFVEEVNFSGERFYVIDLEVTWNHVSSIDLNDYLKELGDFFVLKVVKSVGTYQNTIECPRPKGKKQREKWLQILTQVYNYQIHKDMLAKLVEKEEDIATIQSQLVLLSYISTERGVTFADVDRLLKVQEQKFDFQRFLLRTNFRRIRDHIEIEQPMFLFAVMANTLVKAYTWNEMEDADVEYEEILKTLEISPSSLKDWKKLSSKLSSKAIRNLLNKVDEAQTAYLSGYDYKSILKDAFTEVRLNG